jgi:hypothetical protein
MRKIMLEDVFQKKFRGRFIPSLSGELSIRIQRKQTQSREKKRIDSSHLSHDPEALYLGSLRSTSGSDCTAILK